MYCHQITQLNPQLLSIRSQNSTGTCHTARITTKKDRGYIYVIRENLTHKNWSVEIKFGRRSAKKPRFLSRNLTKVKRVQARIRFRWSKLLFYSGFDLSIEKRVEVENE